ncbi:CAP domain-containing protein [Streptomyces sp. NPDC057686]|uniref:CAP domain-containing protein n=1 Tax=Streptomyces sp. NPDC057686 TaxID=3346212 RepID=UPI0036C9A77C
MKTFPRVHHRASALVAAALMTGGMALATGATATVSHSAVRPAELSPAEQQAIVTETNAVRQQADQPPLTWDATLAAEAQAWADDPASTAGGELHHAPLGNAAENMSGYQPGQATGQWAAEKSDYDADPNHDYVTNRAGYQKWGHYYNMIDSKWHKIGCGAKSGVPIPGGGWVVVCRYAS